MNDNLFSIGDVSRILGITRKIILNKITVITYNADAKTIYTICPKSHSFLLLLINTYGWVLSQNGASQKSKIIPSIKKSKK